MPSARVAQALERFQEDERLTAALTDPAATALLGWIEQQVQAADALPDEAAFTAQVAAIRAAARSAARAEDDPATVVAAAQTALEASAAQAASAAPEEVRAAVAAAPPPSAPAVDHASSSAPRQGLWRALRRRVRRWTHRKVR